MKVTTMTTNNNNQNKTAEQSCNSIAEFIDEISPKITDGKYLELMNNLKNIFDKLTTGQATRQDIIVIRTIFVEAPRQPRRQYEKRQVLTIEEKIQAGYKHCRFCDSYITSKHYAKHQRSQKCESITKIKKATSEAGKVFTAHESRVALEQKNIDEVKQDIIEVEEPEEAEERAKQERQRRRREARREAERVEELGRALRGQPTPRRIVRSSGSRDVVKSDSE